MLRFPHGTQVGLNGPGDITAELDAQDVKATHETAEEIIKRLEEKRTLSRSPKVYAESTRIPAAAVQTVRKGSMRP
jgi:50S ribosomal subunit-associated GTPase HflX